MHTLLFLLLMGLGEVAPADAEARDMGAEEEEVSSEVEIAIAGDSDALAGLGEVLKERLGHLGLQSEIEGISAVEAESILMIPAAPRGPFAHVWIDLSGEEHASLYIVDRSWERLLVRHVRLDPKVGVDEVVREEVAYIIESAMEALLKGGSIGIEREPSGHGKEDEAGESRVEDEAMVSSDEASPEPRLPQSNHTLYLGAGYGTRLWSSSEVPQHGPLVEFLWRTKGRILELGTAFSLQYFLPNTVSGEALGVRLQALDMRLWVHFSRAFSRFRWDADPFLGMEILGEDPKALEEGVEAYKKSTEMIAILGFRTGPGFQLGAGPHRVELRLHAQLDFISANRRYNIEGSGESVFEPWAFRPGLNLQVGWSYLR